MSPFVSRWCYTIGFVYVGDERVLTFHMAVEIILNLLSVLPQAEVGI